MAENLAVPIYIDTNVLLDLLASVQDGFSLVEKVTTRIAGTTEASKTASSEVGTEFGIPNILNLLKIKFGGTAQSKSATDDSHEVETERYHTYGSLLHRLRGYLESEKLIKRFENESAWTTIQASDFVEVRGLIRPNPLVDSLERINRMLKFVSIFSNPSASSSRSSSHGKKSGAGTKQASSTDGTDIRQVKALIDNILADASNNNIRLFVVDIVGLEAGTAVVTLFTNYLRDTTLTEISHKEYRVLGKVVRKITEKSERSINLLPGTVFDGMGKEIFEVFQNSINSLEQFDLPQIQMAIHAPALEVIPIAIYV